MKKINSIWYGGTIAGIGLILVVLIPVMMYCISLLVGFKQILARVSWVSICIGVLILLLFFVLLAIELRQDKRINIFYSNNRNKKTELSDKTFECQNCGNRQVEKDDRYCKVCGIRFD